MRRLLLLVAVAASNVIVPTAAAVAQDGTDPPCPTDTAITIVKATGTAGSNAAQFVVDVNIVGRIKYESSTGFSPGADWGHGVQPGRNTFDLVLVNHDYFRNGEVVEVTLRLEPGREGGDRCTQPDGSTAYTNELAGPPAKVSVTFLSPERQASAKPTGEAAEIDAILEAGGYTVELTTTRTCTVRIVWYHTPGSGKPVIVADGARTAAKRGLVKVEVELTEKGRALLEGATQIKVLAKGSMKCTRDKKPAKTQKAFTLKQ